MFADPTAVLPLSVPGQPTEAPPGSEQKIRIMIERASRREPLFHPHDGIRAGLSTPPAPPAEPLDDLDPLLEEEGEELGLTA